MPALFVFLLKVNAALILFCLGYFIVLRQLTFYTLNRIYLVIAIIFSSVYPLINLNSFAERHQEIAKPVQIVILRLETPTAHFVKPVQQFDYWYWTELVFWLGVSLFTVRLLMQLVSLYKLYRSSKSGTINEQPVRIINEKISPFSFWKSIYINPENLKAADLQNALQHEQVHVKEWHTLDILLAEISVIFYWFNPGVWLIKKAVRENIEFITDRKILQQGVDSKAYQYSLLNVSFLAAVSPQLANHFNISNLKTRIIMMNTKRSSKIKLAGYAFVVPAVITLLLLFSISKADFAKPIRTTFFNTVKPLMKIINTDSYTKPVTKSKNAAKGVSKDHEINELPPVLNIASKTDTSKHGFFSVALDVDAPIMPMMTDTNRYTSVFYKQTKPGSSRNKPAPFAIKSSSVDVSVDSVSKTINNVIIIHQMVFKLKFTDKKDTTQIFSYGFFPSLPDNNTNIIIDGKQATKADMQQLKAAEVERIEAKTDDKKPTATSKYVINIVTKNR